ncbi:MAG: hypothetical protein ACOYJB_10125 [Christensenellaceae bacterium]|jgi:putative DNA primase/helicase
MPEGPARKMIMSSIIFEIIEKTNAKPSGLNQWQGHCPAHRDSDPSLSIRLLEGDTVLLKCFAGCSQESVIEALGLQRADLFPDQKRKNPPPTLQEFADYTRLPISFLKQMKLQQIQNGVKIPYFLASGSEYTRFKIRTSIHGKPRYIWSKNNNDPIIPYGLNRLPLARRCKFLILVEGETDALTLWFHNFPALGLPGADTAKLLKPEYLEGIEKIYAIREPDQGGDTFITGIADRLNAINWWGKYYVIEM